MPGSNSDCDTHEYSVSVYLFRDNTDAGGGGRSSKQRLPFREKSWRYAAKKEKKKQTNNKTTLRPRTNASLDSFAFFFTVSTKSVNENCSHLANVYVKKT